MHPALRLRQPPLLHPHRLPRILRPLPRLLLHRLSMMMAAAVPLRRTPHLLRVAMAAVVRRGPVHRLEPLMMAVEITAQRAEGPAIHTPSRPIAERIPGHLLLLK